MGQEKFDDFKLKILKHVTDEWVKHKEYPPHLFFINENGGRKKLPLPMDGFANSEAKEVLCDTIVDMLSIAKAEMSCITTEGWMISSKEGEAELKDENGDFIRPSQHPDKKEVLTFMFEYENKEEMMTLLNTNGKLSPHNPGPDLGLINDGRKPDQITGIFQGLLKKAKENDKTSK
jgi:hypothetical protein